MVKAYGEGEPDEAALAARTYRGPRSGRSIQSKQIKASIAYAGTWQGDRTLLEGHVVYSQRPPKVLERIRVLLNYTRGR